MALTVSKFPLCCGINVLSGFGNDPTHAHRESPSLEEIDAFLEEMEAVAAGRGRFAESATRRLQLNGWRWQTETAHHQVGMLLCALNHHQEALIRPLLQRHGWRRAGRCNNGGGASDIQLYRKAIHAAEHA